MGSAECGVEVGGGGVLVESEWEGLELLLEGRGGVVAGSGDAAAVEVDGGEGLEDVVELSSGEVDGDGLVAGDAAGVFKEADAVLVEGDAGDGELRLGGWGGTQSRAGCWSGSFRGLGAGDEGGKEQGRGYGGLQGRPFVQLNV